MKSDLPLYTDIWWLKKTFTGLQHRLMSSFVLWDMSVCVGEINMRSFVQFSSQTRTFWPLLDVKEQKLQK